MRSIAGICVALATVIVAGGGTAEAGPYGMRTYEVTITNPNLAQIISPPVVAVHHPSFTLFRTGEEASYGLTLLAEDGMPNHLAGELLADPRVRDVAVADGPVLPGGHRRVYVRAMPGARLSAAGMLVTTNDAFFAVRGVALPMFGSQTSSAPAYDAGSEANNEACAYIPGPPCMNPGERFPEGAEGFITIHNGVHGIGDLPPPRWDWRNPVARVTVRALPGNNDDEGDDENED